MREEYPTDPMYWQTTLFRLSGVENVSIRRLIAGNPDLPREGFLALMADQETEVLRSLSKNPSLPTDLALQLLSHDYASDFIDTDWVDALIATPDLSADDLFQIMEEASWEGIQKALMHPNADEDVLNSYFCLNGVVDDPALASALLKRFPWGQYPEVWTRIKESSQWSRTLLSCPETPQAFLVWMAWEQRQFAEFDGSWGYAYEISEEICRHPQADAEVFSILMEDEGFIEKDYWHDFDCLRIISEHPKASVHQKAEALARIQKQMDEGGEEE